jgi:hypothetical protein
MFPILLGAGIGALADTKNRGKGAAIGAVIGLGAEVLIGAVMGVGMVAALTRMNAGAGRAGAPMPGAGWGGTVVVPSPSPSPHPHTPQGYADEVASFGSSCPGKAG